MRWYLLSSLMFLISAVGNFVTHGVNKDCICCIGGVIVTAYLAFLTYRVKLE